MIEFAQIFVTTLLVCFGYIFWIPIKTEVLPELKPMGWMHEWKWFWISIVVLFYIVLVAILVCTWTLPGFILPAK